eukprot:GFUD01061790.1.p1 GENE.GFUD01061790.1~~GFUD01061790.1.p1  ORF type:complete len:208 (+),score=69.45 GFUD01061790.1:25-624(+)
MRMNRYFKRSSKIVKIEHFLSECKLGDWFVLYQLSKNLNRPFFMDFLTHLSVRYAHGHVCDEEDPDEDGPLLEQMNHFLKPSSKVPAACRQDSLEKGDNVLEMITRPKITLDEPDDKGGKDDKEEDDDSEEDEEEEEEEKEKKQSKSKSKKDDGDERVDLPLGDDIDSALSRKKGEVKEQVSSKSYKTPKRTSAKSRKH